MLKLWTKVPRRVIIFTINHAAKDTLAAMPEAMTRGGDKVNGWNIGRENMDTYFTSYLRRPNVELGRLGANLP
jgi:hypothetical protein